MESPFARWKWMIVLLAGFLVWQVVLNAPVLVVVGIDLADAPAPSAVWIQAIGAALGLAVFAIGLHLLYRWPGRGLSEIGLTTKAIPRDAVLGFAIGLATAALSIFVVLPLLGSAADEMLGAVAPLTENRGALVATLLLLVLRGGLLEEMFFRGHLIHATRNMLGGGAIATTLAITLSVVLFAFAHRYQGMIGIVSASVFALIFAGLYVWTKRLTASIFAHATHDVLSLLGIMFLVL